MTKMIRRRRLGASSCRGITSFSKTGITYVNNYDDEAMATLSPNELTIRWGCTSTVPSSNVLNTARAIHEVSDKAGFRIKCSDAGVSPKSRFNWDLISNGLRDGLDYPLIVRPSNHSQGRNLFLCNNEEELIEAISKSGETGYTSEYIPKVKEYRVAVVQGRVAWVVEKTPSNPEDIAWNVSQGGRFDNVRWDNWPLNVVETAIKAFNLSSLDFGGVDVMVDAEGKAYVLEINSAPSLTSPYRQECFAKCFDYIVEHGKERMELAEYDGWRKYIHPSIWSRS